MREILFRGKRVDNGEWAEGYFCKGYFSELPHDRYGIMYKTKPIPGKWHLAYMTTEIDFETVGQYIGLTDKNGKRIFDGDIIRCGGKVVGVVNYHDCCFCVRFIMKDHANRSNPAMDIIENEYPNDIEVIGNIHDNPELLGGDIHGN